MVEAAIETWARWLMGEILVMKPLLATVMSEEAMSFLEAASVTFGPVTFEDGFALMMQRHAIARQWSSFLEEHPVIVGPTWTQPPFEHGFDVRGPDETMATLELIRFVTPMNLLGLPAACVPTGTADGLPLGVQVISRWFREDVCLDAAEAIDAAFAPLTPVEPRR